MNIQPTIIILIGITGDLSKRKLLPAIESLRNKGVLPEQFELVGVTRSENSQGYFQMDLENPEDYQRLAQHLEAIETMWGVSAQRLFYLSVAPTVSNPIIAHLETSGLASVANTKLLLEKPFALDIGTAFSEENIYRIDHYLAKTSVRTLPVLDLSHVERIEVEAVEAIGIEGRGHFYEQTGALRDFVQSHLLEVAAQAILPANRPEALREFSETIGVRRGQYNGYREAVQNPESNTETFVSILLQSTGPSFKGEVLLKTGKAMDAKRTNISVFYTDGASQVFSLHDTDNAYEKVFIEAMQGKKEFFIVQEEVAETIRIVQPIEEAWAKDSEDLFFYEQGTDSK
ncbi:MAG: zwf, glucose-6-phosphate 1-dehydrogenase [Candidatus Nomurabacteria bacterium]|nr:zwf, glucose-6-phosphate 1-dehydrogenase [Candidatus Nomurabacteria bacterium]